MSMTTKKILEAKVISRDELAQMLMNITEATHGSAVIATIRTATKPKFAGGKRANPDLQDKVIKYAKTNIMLQFNYEANVKAQLLREGKDPNSFEAEPAKWGTQVGKSALILHNGNKYVYVRIIKSLAYQYRDLDGNPLDKDAINPKIYKSPSSKQGLEKEVIVRKYKLDNVLGFTAFGTHFVLPKMDVNTAD